MSTSRASWPTWLLAAGYGIGLLLIDMWLDDYPALARWFIWTLVAFGIYVSNTSDGERGSEEDRVKRNFRRMKDEFKELVEK